MVFANHSRRSHVFFQRVHLLPSSSSSVSSHHHRRTVATEASTTTRNHHPSSSHHRRRVVVTGIGAITPQGPTFETTWKNITKTIPKNNNQNKTQNNNNDCSNYDDDDVGITTLERAIHLQNLPSFILEHDLEVSKILPSQVAAPVRGVDYDPRLPRFVQFALRAGDEAIRAAGLDSWLGLHAGGINDDDDGVAVANNNDTELELRRVRTGVSIGSGMSSVREIVSAHRTINTDTSSVSIRRLSPHFVPKVLGNSASGRLSLHHNLKGPNLSPTTACAAGAHAIGEAVRCIQYGDADIMLAGGAEACIDPLSMAGFCRLRALSTLYNDNPLSSSRPFDEGRDGFVIGEGAAVLVLEGLDHALERGARILCEVSGYGLTGDAFHVTSPDPGGGGAERAMMMALERAGIGWSGDGGGVDYVNAHATSTPMGDGIEEMAIDRVLMREGGMYGATASGGGENRQTFVSSTKGATGHLLGAAGAIEAAFAVMSIVDGVVPPTENLIKGGDVKSFTHVIGSSICNQEINVAVSNSFGFGGTNASLVFSKLS